MCWCDYHEFDRRDGCNSPRGSGSSRRWTAASKISRRCSIASPGSKTATRVATEPATRHLDVVPGALGADAGLLGAAHRGFQEFGARTDSGAAEAGAP